MEKEIKHHINIDKVNFIMREKNIDEKKLAKLSNISLRKINFILNVNIKSALRF